MDLKSMLNESGAHRPAGPPPLHTPQSSYDARTSHTPTSELSSARPTPYGGPVSSLDTRASGSGSAAGQGSYFAVQSPHPNTSASVSTPSAGPNSAYAQSPGSYIQSYTPRDAGPPQNPPFLSPSPSAGHHPPTPGSAHPSAYNAYPHVHPSQHPYSQYQSPPPPQPNGLPPSQARIYSPSSHPQPYPATPLGPPVGYPKVSPQANRPISRGHEHFAHRRASQSSAGSVQSREYSHSSIPTLEHVRRDSIARSYSQDLRDREQSISVSPKTIPKPSPYRELSTSSQGIPLERPSLEPHGRSSSQMTIPRRESFHRNIETQTPPSALQSSMPPQMPSAQPEYPPQPPQPSTVNGQQPPTNVKREEDERPMKQESAFENSAPPPAEPPSLKRRASQLSQSPARFQQSKKPRRMEAPVWAQCARHRPPRFVASKGRSQTHNQQRPQPQQQQQTTPLPPPSRPMQPHTNGNQPPNRQSTAPEMLEPEASIADVIPYEDLTRQVCDWIARTIGLADPPQDSVFEIEGKVGAIVSADDDVRVIVPVLSEAIFDRSRYGKTKFISSMNPLQHQKLNEYLNGLIQQREEQLRHGMAKHRIHYAHPKENDLFFELTDEGKNNIPPSVRDWIFAKPNRNKEIKVRRTVNKETGANERTIIKTRIEDMDIVSPRTDFDFRISLSIESDCTQWLDDAWLKPIVYGRNKDRLSYRHMMYQIDLTQVSYDGNTDKEHELEVEIATPVIRQELEKLKAQQPSNYENMIKGLVDNVRLLCRKGSLREA